MVGQLVSEKGGRGRVSRADLYGMPVLRAGVDPESRWEERRLARAGRELRRAGTSRLLAPAEFSRWPQLEAQGFRPVTPDRFLRAQALPIALRALEHRQMAPDRATVALCARRADGEMARMALELSRHVRRLVIDAPGGGERLALWLHREWGVPVLPRQEEAHMAVYLSEREENRTEQGVELFGSRPRLDGVRVCAPELRQEHREDLAVLSLLWEGGFLSKSALKIT